MQGRKYIEKTVIELLNNGFSFYESAIRMSSPGLLAEADMRGINRAYLSGWLGGFNKELKIEKMTSMKEYEEGYNGGSEFRTKLEKRYMN
jgi:hypothetical protein